MRVQKIFNKKNRTKLKKIVAVYLAISILAEAINPVQLYALTGGPSQPEVQSFEPVGTSDMVDIFSGDFNYNIPLMDVDGYPINISYHSGITMDQEASWVGLGWNINPGVINRGMRGIPDDFDGEAITKEYNMRPNKTYGLNVGGRMEVLGADAIQLGASVGLKYNNYLGVGMEQSVNISLSSGSNSKGALNGNLGITSSSDEGLSLQPSVGLSVKEGVTNRSSVNLGLTVGTSFNSRGGLKTLSINTSAGYSFDGSKTMVKYKGENFHKGQGSVNESIGAGAAFDFGMPTYTPQVNMPMHNGSVSGSFTLGGEIYSVHGNVNVTGYYSYQELMTNNISNPAYGYMNADEGVKHDNALLDFNREKDGVFSGNTPALPITNFTYDIYSVSGQGIGGSYRPFRSDMGHVFDAYSFSTTEGDSYSAEVGLGNTYHGGTDITSNSVTTSSGNWSTNNIAETFLTPRSSVANDPLYEPYYFKEASEKSVESDPSFFVKQGQYKAESIKLNGLAKFNIIADAKFADGTALPPENYRKKRDKRNQSISILKKSELAKSGLEDIPNLSTSAQPHHIAEITTIRTDGARYVYGIAAYNTLQDEVTFAVGQSYNGTTKRTANAVTGLVKYMAGADNSKSNQMGLDAYYSKTSMPPYAHSYLLTAVLSPDYIDSDTKRGPSDGDQGGYTSFKYEKISNYKWRVPFGADSATFSEGLSANDYDDKGNYIYGEKEMWYLDSIITKNYIAVFVKQDTRLDGRGVKGKDGGYDAILSGKSRSLKKIRLFSKADIRQNGLAAVPIKEVYFYYDNSLCPGISNTSSVGSGKLTLKKIFFKYQNSNIGRFSPYQFTYSTHNPGYNIKGYDRWGNYKPNEANGFVPTTTKLSSAEYPYSEQNPTLAASYADAWTLKSIDLPSGGKISVNYEPDDYAYVQNKQAMQMFKIINFQTAPTTAADVDSTTTPNAFQPKSLNPGSSTALTIKLQDPIASGDYDEIFKERYLNNIDYFYFRCYVMITSSPARYEFVSGYLTKNDIDFANCKVSSDGVYATIGLKNVTLNDNGGGDVCPITKAAIQFGRLNMSREVWGEENLVGQSASFGKDLLEAMRKSNFFTNISEAIKGPNQTLYSKYNVGKTALTNKSWIRLKNPNKKKIGGGLRVTKIQISDEWSGMTGAADNSVSYGQEYSYAYDDGTSTGVATYEPQLGGDENPWRTPVFTVTKNLLAPDDQQYMEEPFGEMFFPSPSVGYARVTVKNLQYGNVNKHATGKVVHEFYTAKEFPTITSRTSIDARREKTPKISISTLLKMDVKEYMTASQGYLVELNDMHGKPKSQAVYQEDKADPITSVNYNYKSTPYLTTCRKVDNTATAVYPDGSVDKNASLGVFYDFVSDMRQSTSETTSSTTKVNVDGFIIPPVPIPIPFPMILPSFANEATQFRSVVVTKVIQRFGILEETVAKDLGSVVSTKNLAYDSETGEVLLTSTTTDYNDTVYSLTVPAHWYYDGMGPAYKNIGYSHPSVLSFSNGVSSYLANAANYFAEGDELLLSTGGGIYAWVTKVNANSIEAIFKDGFPVGSNGTLVKVMRSGRRNLQATPIATVTTLINPLDGIKANTYEQVIQASATEFTNSWRTFCDCYDTGRPNAVVAGEGKTKTTNPFVLGTRGFWKQKRSFLHLTGRTQSEYNNNTNIRKDGLFTSFTPFYRLNNGKWLIDEKNWTYATEVTEFSPLGMELENKDALGRYSSAVYGYNQSLPVSVAANARYKDMGVDAFEDYGFSDCADKHFKFNPDSVVISSAESHTGKYSIRVSSGSPEKLTKQLTSCNLVDCTLDATVTNNGSNTTATISSGTGPYSFEWINVSGDPLVYLSDNGQSLVVEGTGCSVEVTVRDAKNCKVIKTVSR